jgi:signal peptidase I
LVALALLLILLQFFSPTIVREHSMEDTLKENDIIYVARQAYLLGAPRHGDIVVFQTALENGSGGEKVLVKRVIGLPGDRIAIIDNVVYRNGEALEEPYLKSERVSGQMSERTVPAESYFVMGDNRAVSNDSRGDSIGFITKDQLQGKALFRIFPLSDFKWF